jgi:hypothetical protein
VCRDWRDIATLGSTEATLDLAPAGFGAAAAGGSEARKAGSGTAGSSQRARLFFQRCPQLRKLTYHVSPRVTLAQVRVAWWWWQRAARGWVPSRRGACCLDVRARGVAAASFMGACSAHTALSPAATPTRTPMTTV